MPSRALYSRLAIHQAREREQRPKPSRTGKKTSLNHNFVLCYTVHRYRAGRGVSFFLPRTSVKSRDTPSTSLLTRLPSPNCIVLTLTKFHSVKVPDSTRSGFYRLPRPSPVLYVLAGVQRHQAPPLPTLWQRRRPPRPGKAPAPVRPRPRGHPPAPRRSRMDHPPLELPPVVPVRASIPPVRSCGWRRSPAPVGAGRQPAYPLTPARWIFRPEGSRPPCRFVRPPARSGEGGRPRPDLSGRLVPPSSRGGCTHPPGSARVARPNPYEQPVRHGPERLPIAGGWGPRPTANSGPGAFIQTG